MENFRTIILLASVGLTCVTAVNPWRDLIPDGKEAVYEYQALVKAGTRIPHSFASTFTLNGKLHVQTDPVNGLFLRLADLTYTVDNGRMSEMRETVKVPITENLSALQNTFKVKHSGGQANGIITEENDPQFSVSMKKAIGSIMQLDLLNISLDTVKSEMFSTKEMSPFGIEIEWYNVLPEGDTLTIHKMHEMKTSYHLYQYMVSNVEPNYCDKYYEDPLSHDSQKSYTIVKKPEGRVLTHIESNGGIYLQPFQAESVALYVYVNQTFNLQAISAQQKAMYISKERHHYSLDERLTGAPYEMVSDTQTLLPVVEQMLHEIVNYMAQSDHLVMERPNFKQGQLINRIQRVLVHFSLPMLKTMHNTLLQKTEVKDLMMLDMFYNLLPLIGTHDSLVFIVNLIQEKQIKESVASNMLKKMPFHVRMPRVKLIHDMDALLHLTEASWTLQKLAVLSFSNILHKFYAYTHTHFHDHFYMHSDMHHMEHDQDSFGIYIFDMFEKYMIDFINIIKTSQKREEQLLYLEAVHNLKVEHVIRHLEKAIKGEWWNDNQLRMMAMWAVAPVAKKDPEKAIELYWPIFTDRMLPAELRITAFFVIMNARPSLSRVINVYWFMQNEPQQTVYQFYYSYIKSLSETTDPCSSKLKLFAKQILIYTPMPYLHGLTGYHSVGYLDKKYNFGNDIGFYFINTPNTQIFSIALNIQSMNIHLTPTTVYVKVTGLDAALFENFKLTVTKNMKVFNCDEILQYIDNIATGKKVQIELTLLHYYQVVEFLFYDSASMNIKTMWPMLKTWYEDQFSFTKRYVDLHYELLSQIYIPTEIGFPAVFDVLMPSVEFGSISVKKSAQEKTTSVHIVGKHRSWNHGSHGVSFHNPIIRAWQGANRYTSLNSISSIDMEISVNHEMMVFSWKGKNNSIEVKSHVANMVFVKDYLHNNILKKTSPNSRNWVVVAGDDKFKSEPLLIDGFTIYDADNAIADRKLWDEDQIEYSGSICKQILTLMHHNRYIKLQPDVMTRGIMRKIKGGEADEISLRLNQINHDTSPNLPAMKLNTKAKFTRFTMTDEKERAETYNVNAVLDINSGHTANSLKMQITRTSAGETDFNICVEGNEKYTDEDITGILDIALSQSADGKCSNDSVIHISMFGKQLPKEVQFSENYDVCLKNVWSPIRHMKPYSCYTALSSIRNYTIDIKPVNVPEEIQQGLWNHLMEEIVLKDVTIFKSTHSENLGENDYRVHLHYPFNEEVLDVEVHTPKYGFKINDIDRKYLTWKGVYPDNTQYSNMHRIMHNLGLNHVCSVNNNHVVNIKHQMKDAVTADWSLLFGDSAQNTKHGVWVKIMDNRLAMKIMHNMHLLVILPHKMKFTVTLDGKMIDDDVRSYSQDWFHFDVLDNSDLFVFLSKYLGHQIVYNGDQIQMEIPKMDMELAGLCFNVDS